MSEPDLEPARAHLAWLLWCFNEGYIKAEDRAIMSNWMLDDPDSLHPDDLMVRDELLTMADEVLSLIGEGAPGAHRAPEGRI